MAGFRLLLFNLLLLLLLVDGYILKEKVQDYASDEGDEDLSIPENAKGRDGWTPPPRRRPGNYANAKREDVEENRCYCTYGDDGCGAKDYCVKDVGAACFHAVEQNVIYEEGRRRVITLHRYGCAPLERGSDASHLTCNAWRISHYIPRSIACCYEGKLCNQDLEVPPYSGHFDWDDDGEGADKVQLLFSRSSILCIIFGATAIVVALLYFAYIGHKARTNGEFRWLPRKKQSPLYEENHEKSPILADASSGSGSGMPTLSQRTVAQELKYLGEPPLGRGRYGEVKKALYRGSYVAVKTFSTRDEESWKNERDVYQTQMLNHENILQFVAADITSVDSMTQMLLITDYHKFGSLADYLDREPTLTIHEALELAYSAMCGIEHLHNPVHGTGSRRKPEIAHRDIKSKNVIVKRPGVCCIADFGLAVTFDKDGMHPPKVNIQVGTKRYMAPEVLSKTLNPESFGQFKMADMYSFALVLWEIARRVEIGNERVAEGPLPAAAPLGGYSSSSSGIGSSVHSSSEFRPQEQKKSEDNSTAKKYEPPFEGMVDHDPSLDQMALIVCTQKKRPPVEEAWLAEGGNASLRVLCNLMLDCWHETPGCRHTALKVKKELRRALDVLIETSQTATTTTSSPTDALSTSSR